MLYLFPWPEVLVKTPGQLSSALGNNAWFVFLVSIIVFFAITWPLVNAVDYSPKNTGVSDRGKRRIRAVLVFIVLALLAAASTYFGTYGMVQLKSLRSNIYLNAFLHALIPVGTHLILLGIMRLAMPKSKIATVFPL